MVHSDGIWNDLELLCQYLGVLTPHPLGLHFNCILGILLFDFIEKGVGPHNI